MPNLEETVALASLTELLYPFLPASRAPVTFGSIGISLGLKPPEGKVTKRTVIEALVTQAHEHSQQKLGTFVLRVVEASIRYRSYVHKPLELDELVAVRDALESLRIRIPELHREDFLRRLAPAANSRRSGSTSASPTGLEPRANGVNKVAEKRHRLGVLLEGYLELGARSDRQAAGIELEPLLCELFGLFDLSPRAGFCVTGQQVDGALELSGQHYLVEAKWTAHPIGFAELATFQAKVEGKSHATFGIVITINGVTSDGLEALTRGKSPRIVVIDGNDLYNILKGEMPLDDFLRLRVRLLAQEGAVKVNFERVLRDYHLSVRKAS